MDMADTETVQVVDVNVDSAGDTWPVLLRAVCRADFIALDLELSGLGSAKTRGVDSLDERYKVMREVADTHSVLSLGVACFRWDERGGESEGGGEERERGGEGWKEEGRNCSAEVFNVWLSCQRDYILNPQSACFLLEHGFDFNKQLSKGLPYTPGQAPSLSDSTPSPHCLMALVLTRGCPLALHNGWLDLIFLYHSFHAPLPPSHPTFMADWEEMLSGGVFDTKAIANYLLHWEASFLEYVFRRSQYLNSCAATDGRAHLSLSFQTSCPLAHVERAPLLPPPHPLSQEERLALPFCGSFSVYGGCHKKTCSDSHDVCVLVEQQEKWAESKAAKRRAKRRRKENCRDRDCDKVEGEEVEGEGGTVKKQNWLLAPFSSDIATAKLRLHQPALPTSSSRKPSFGHRAGFDAFMTGFSLATSAVRLRPRGSAVSWLAGLEGMRNALANRSQPVPNQIAKSHFASVSEAHLKAWAQAKVTFDNYVVTT